MRTIKRRAEKLPDKGKGRSHFDRDYTAILYSHAFRRLKHKTQVFFFAQNDHVCTRLEHSLYVATTSEIVCKNLRKKGVRVNPLLARTIGLGHDLGHPPFGHAGETTLKKLAKSIGGFYHEAHGLRIVDKIEKPRSKLPIIGLNLTVAVRDGIRNHCGEDRSTSITPSPELNLDGGAMPYTLEGCVVRLVDKVAYLGRDIEDAITAELVSVEDLPGDITGRIGNKNGEIVDYLVGDLIDNSTQSRIALSKDASELMQSLASFSKDAIYQHESVAAYILRVEDVLETLFYRFCDVYAKYEKETKAYFQHELAVVQIFGQFIADRSTLYYNEERKQYNSSKKLRKRIVIDFLSTLTDHFAFQACSEFFLPKPLV